MEKINDTLLIKLDLLELLHRDADDNVVAERIIDEHIIPEKQLNAELLEGLKMLVEANPNDSTWNYAAAVDHARKLITKAEQFKLI